MGPMEDVKGSEGMADGHPTGSMDALDALKDPFLARRSEDGGPDDLFDGDW